MKTIFYCVLIGLAIVILSYQPDLFAGPFTFGPPVQTQKGTSKPLTKPQATKSRLTTQKSQETTSEVQDSRVSCEGVACYYGPTREIDSYTKYR